MKPGESLSEFTFQRLKCGESSQWAVVRDEFSKLVDPGPSFKFKLIETAPPQLASRRKKL